MTVVIEITIEQQKPILKLKYFTNFKFVHWLKCNKSSLFTIEVRKMNKLQMIKKR